MSKECEKIHKYIRNLERHAFPFNKDKVYKNGVYILFEKDEVGHGGDRIVRVGSHTGNDNLIKRLEEHFYKENKDRSIFRKNIGRALLNKKNDTYLDVWDIDFTKSEVKKKYGELLDKEYQENIEQEVSKYIIDKFTFSVIEVIDKNERLSTEKSIINIVSACSECNDSNNWLGRFSTIEKIKKSGLWQTQHIKER